MPGPENDWLLEIGTSVKAGLVVVSAVGDVHVEGLQGCGCPLVLVRAFHHHLAHVEA